MAATQGMVAAEILSAYDFGKHRAVLDAGGGDGSFLRRLGADYPHLALKLFDLPEVVGLAPAGMAAVGGDLLEGPWPAGADLITLIRVLHDHPDESVVRILRQARAALPVGGTLLVAEPMAAAKGAEPVGAAYFGFYLLAMGSGRARRFELLRALLQAAGFGRVRRHATGQPLITSVIAARAM
jgi:demethylspheroidene O-methyltransferase